MLGSELRQERREILGREGPSKRGRRLLIVVFELAETVFDVSQGREVLRREHLALDDREVDLDLIQPAGVDRGMNEDEAWPRRAETRTRARPGARSRYRRSRTSGAPSGRVLGS